MHPSYLLFVAILINGCQSGKNSVSADNTITRDTSSTQTELGIIGNDMPIYGNAYNQKGGAVLVTETQTYWMDGLSSWDDNLVGKPVRVWGEIIVRDDNPVFLDTGKIVSQGIPVETEAELEAQRNRYWLVNCKYELIRP